MRALARTREPTMAQLTAFASVLERAGLLEITTDEKGNDAYRLTADGMGVNRMLAMASRQDADDVLDALLARPTSLRVGDPLRLS